MSLNTLINMNKNISRVLYAGFLLFGIYMLISSRYGDAAMYFGIGLAFDPFDQEQSWKDRPLWQKAWLLVHLGICSASLGLEIGIKG